MHLLTVLLCASAHNSYIFPHALQVHQPWEWRRCELQKEATAAMLHQEMLLVGRHVGVSWHVGVSCLCSPAPVYVQAWRGVSIPLHAHAFCYCFVAHTQRMSTCV
jgi:hypothetical protein